MMMKILAILNNRCPNCEKGSIFDKDRGLINLSIPKMNKTCPSCGFQFVKETGFFYGAMYVSYALGVAFSVATFIIAHFFIGFGLFASFISIIVVLILLMPIIMRLSRNIWINFFLSYKKTT